MTEGSSFLQRCKGTQSLQAPLAAWKFSWSSLSSYVSTAHGSQGQEQLHMLRPSLSAAQSPSGWQQLLPAATFPELGGASKTAKPLCSFFFAGACVSNPDSPA